MARPRRLNRRGARSRRRDVLRASIRRYLVCDARLDDYREAAAVELRHEVDSLDDRVMAAIHESELAALRKGARARIQEAGTRARAHRYSATGWGYARYGLGALAALLPVLVVTDAISDTGWRAAASVTGALAAAALTFLQPGSAASDHEAAAVAWESVQRHGEDYVVADTVVLNDGETLLERLHELTRQADEAAQKSPNVVPLTSQLAKPRARRKQESSSEP